MTIPNSVTSLGCNVFYGCSSLASLYFDGNAPDISWEVFYGVTATAYYPANDATWTEDKIQNYGGTITWVGYKILLNSIFPFRKTVLSTPEKN